MSEENDLDIEGLRDFYSKEQEEYLLQSAQWCQLPDGERIGERFTGAIHHPHSTTCRPATRGVTWLGATRPTQ